MELNGLLWRKSTRSTDNGGDCVELTVWRKSTHSTDNGGACVELAMLPLALSGDDVHAGEPTPRPAE